MAKKGRIFSGMRPTGRLHLGHLEGVIKNWVELQEDYETYFGIVDWHALTTSYQDTETLRENKREIAIDWLSSGIDPEKSHIFVQSDVKEHAELHLLLSMLTPVSWVERCPTYKEQIQELGSDIATYGFLGYPVLMAADILVYRSTHVPVGEDQAPHLELAREIARRFNHLYGELFPEPETLYSETPNIRGLDGRKMSKSYGNTLPISAPPEEIRDRVKSMVTDPQRVRRDDPGRPEVCNVYDFRKLYTPQTVDQIAEDCRGAEIGCVACKEQLAEGIVSALAGIHDKRQELEKNPKQVDEILFKGAERAREEAQNTLARVREVMRI